MKQFKIGDFVKVLDTVTREERIEKIETEEQLLQAEIDDTVLKFEDVIIEETKVNKYKREIKKDMYIDVYDVLKAFEVSNPAIQHAVKNLLAGGKRGYKDITQDFEEAIVSIQRGIELEIEK